MALGRAVAVAGLCWVVLTADPAPATLAASGILTGDSGLRGDGALSVVGWLAAGALAGGAVGWAVATVVAPGIAGLGLGLGLAVGGGFGAVLKLVVLDRTEPEPPESVTVTGGAETPSPQPADLFEDHPDPVLYYDDAGDGPVVRAANGAFEETFGVTASAVEGSALADATMVVARTGDVVDAAAAGDGFEARLDCETATGVDPFRVRVVAVGDDAGTRGYVLYSPVE